MPEFCLKKEIEKKLPTNDRFTIALIVANIIFHICINFNSYKHTILYPKMNF